VFKIKQKLYVAFA